MNKRGLFTPISAVACYHVATGVFLGMLRMRLIEALPTSVGRHGLPSGGGPAARVETELQWRASLDGPAGLVAEMAEFVASLQASHPPAGLLGGLVGGAVAHPPEAADVLRDVAFVECYPWERPRPRLLEALRLQAFHGKPIRADLRLRFSAEMDEADVPPLSAPARLPLAG